MKDALAQGSVNLRDTDASRSACVVFALAPAAPPALPTARAAPLALPMDGAAEPPSSNAIQRCCGTSIYKV